MRKISRLTAIILINIFLASCGALTVAQRGEYIDQKSMPIGTPRKILLVKFGEPIDTETKDGLKTDIFRVVQGETTGSKVAKSVGIIFFGYYYIVFGGNSCRPSYKTKGICDF